MDREVHWIVRGEHTHTVFLSAKLAAIRHIAVRLQPHFRKIGDNALLLTGLGNVFAVQRYKKVPHPRSLSQGEREGNGLNLMQ
jgi:hypothetical protein